MFLVYGLFSEGELFYIGKTTEDRLDLRLVEHKSNAKRSKDKNLYVYNKIRKIFREEKDITIKVLFRFDSEEEQTAKEIELIALHGRKKYDPAGILYNMTAGGEGIVGIKHTDSAKKKMSLSKMGNQYNVGVKRPDMVERWAKKVYLYDLNGNRLDEEYNSCHAAGEDLGISFKKISECIKFSRKCKVDRWSDFIQFSYEDVDKLPAYEENRKLKRVAQYTLDGTLVKEYDSVQEILEQNPSFKKSTLNGVCNGTSKSAYKYKWNYLN